MRQFSLVNLRVTDDRAARTRPAVSAGLAQVMTESSPVSMPTLTSRTPQAASPPAANQASEQLCFGGFVLTPDERRLTKDGAPIELGGRSFALLVALIEQPGRVIPKRELLRRVWPDVTVEDVALRFHMSRLRKALGDGRGGQRLITTQVGVGYGFVGVVNRSNAQPLDSMRPRLVPRETRLPCRLDRLIGRERELRSLVERVAGVRLLTVVGPAGVGKTSLAIEAAHDLAPGFADGATFVDLTAVQAPDMLVSAVAMALGLVCAAKSSISAILDQLRDRHQLIVLDNAEHLVLAVAWLCEEIVAAAPGVQVIATSRQALRARNEHVHRLMPHDAPAAIELFMHHFSTASGVVDAAPGAARTIATICQRLDGVALPIELVAIRAALHGIDATSRILGDPPSLSWPGRRTAPSHQRTLKASLDWSFDLLTGAALQVFEAISKLEPAFSLEQVVAAVTDHTLDRASVSTALDELADKSLILVDAGQYRYPEMTRLYACGRWGSAHRAQF